MASARPGPGASAVRWNSLENLTPRGRSSSRETSTPPAGRQTLSYAVAVNAVSRLLVKASFATFAAVYVARNFRNLPAGGRQESGRGYDDTVAAEVYDVLLAPLGLLVAHGDLLQWVAGWVSVVVVAPLVVSAMVLNNAERMGAYSVDESRARARETRETRARRAESAARKAGYGSLEITPPARSPYGGNGGVGGEGSARGGRAGGGLFSVGDTDGGLMGVVGTMMGTMMGTPGTPGMMGESAMEGAAPPATPGSTRSLRTPGSTRMNKSTVGTPGSARTPPIQAVLQDFEAAADAAVAATDARQTTFAQQMGLQQQQQQMTFMSMQQPLSSSFAQQMMQQPLSNTYRPSAVRKGYVSTPLRSDGSVVSSLPTDRDLVLAELGIDEDILERAVEALREWIACRLLQPLVKVIAVAHTNVINSAKSIGIEVPRDSLIDLNDYGAEPSSRLSDQMLSLGNFYAQVTQQMAVGANANNPTALKRYERCLRSIVTYNGLLRLLRAELIPGLLPASPDGYILRRIKELANGTAMYDFVFDAGGESNGRAWNAEYPTDTALVLYLFACFLAAPFWSFPDKMDYSKVEGPADVLFLGKLPPRIGGEFTAILSSRLPKGCVGTALQGLQLGATNPHIAITVEGVPKLTESGQLGLFRTIVLWLMYVADGNGVLGNVALSSLHLDAVLSKRRGFAFIEQLRKLHLW